MFPPCTDRGAILVLIRPSFDRKIQLRVRQILAQNASTKVLLGEAGVGKSRLCYEFKIIEQRASLVLEAASHGKAYPYLPLTDLGSL